MQVNLRKAAAILAEIKPNTPVIKVTVPPHTKDTKSFLSCIESEQLEAFVTSVNLLSAEYQIRELVQAANYGCGVNALVTQLAATKKVMALTELISNSEPQDDLAITYELEYNAKQTYPSPVYSYRGCKVLSPRTKA